MRPRGPTPSRSDPEAGLPGALVRGMHLASAYAIWSAVGISAIALLGIVLFDEPIARVQLLGLALVTAGVIALQTGARGG
jgi:small multidrug resistance pump